MARFWGGEENPCLVSPKSEGPQHLKGDVENFPPVFGDLSPVEQKNQVPSHVSLEIIQFHRNDLLIYVNGFILNVFGPNSCFGLFQGLIFVVLWTNCAEKCNMGLNPNR
jgi:hypothetical protein